MESFYPPKSPKFFILPLLQLSVALSPFLFGRVLRFQSFLPYWGFGLFSGFRLPIFRFIRRTRFGYIQGLGLATAAGLPCCAFFLVPAEQETFIALYLQQDTAETGYDDNGTHQEIGILHSGELSKSKAEGYGPGRATGSDDPRNGTRCTRVDVRDLEFS